MKKTIVAFSLAWLSTSAIAGEGNTTTLNNELFPECFQSGTPDCSNYTESIIDSSKRRPEPCDRFDDLHKGPHRPKPCKPEKPEPEEPCFIDRDCDREDLGDYWRGNNGDFFILPIKDKPEEPIKIPEPTSLALIAFGALGLLLSKRKK